MDSSAVPTTSLTTPVIVIITVVLCITAYVVVYRIYPSAKSEELLPEAISLAKKKNIMMPDRVQTELLGSAGSTVMGFFYLNQGDKTLRQGKADQYIPLLQVENNWVVEVIPSPKEKGDYGARLRIQTQKDGTFQYEVIPLPSLPKQRWVFLAILREGRRFDVLYDSRIVASKRLAHYPVVIAGSLSVGEKRLDGKAIHVKVNSSRLSPEEVERERKARVDTEGRIVGQAEEKQDIDWGFLPSLRAQCPPGFPCHTVTEPPSKNLYQWKTPYA